MIKKIIAAAAAAVLAGGLLSNNPITANAAGTKPINNITAFNNRLEYTGKVQTIDLDSYRMDKYHRESLVSYDTPNASWALIKGVNYTVNKLNSQYTGQYQMELTGIGDSEGSYGVANYYIGSPRPEIKKITRAGSTTNATITVQWRTPANNYYFDKIVPLYYKDFAAQNSFANSSTLANLTSALIGYKIEFSNNKNFTAGTLSFSTALTKNTFTLPNVDLNEYKYVRVGTFVRVKNSKTENIGTQYVMPVYNASNAIIGCKVVTEPAFSYKKVAKNAYADLATKRHVTFSAVDTVP